MPIEHFVVDSRLLRELGERLVGKPHIALAELIKNSYDADARQVEITFSPDRIEVVDDGHGMSHRAFSSRWMRIGTTIKEEERFSPELERSYTGSKGVGRLSVQLLARKLELHTVGLKDPSLRGWKRRVNADTDQLHREVVASVDWDRAVNAGSIGQADVEVSEQRPASTFAGGSRCGTRLILTGVTHRWTAESFRRLAQELWPLQPPFDVHEDDESAFRITLDSPYSGLIREFDAQMRAVLDIWTARIQGHLLPEGNPVPKGEVYEVRNDIFAIDEEQRQARPRYLQLSVKLRNNVPRNVILLMDPCDLDNVSYEVRVFDLRYRQPQGVRVGIARDYLNEYGGVHIYDGGFHLPYYGPDVDWLRIEQDHAHRLSTSKLLPDALQVPKGLQDLTTNSRLYGAVEVSTTQEALAAQKSGSPNDRVLSIQATRDRLVGNEAFDQLRRLVRSGLDLYAMENARTKLAKARIRARPQAPPSAALRQVAETVASVRDAVPPNRLAVFDQATAQLSEAVADVEAIEEATKTQASLLGALATAGMTALAYEHEIAKQVASIESMADRLSSLAASAPDSLARPLSDTAASLRLWVDRTHRIRTIFTPLLDEETRVVSRRFKARKLIEDVASHLTVLSRGATIDASGVPPTLRLPKGSSGAWSAVFQNLFINAFNAMLDVPVKQVEVGGGGDDDTGWIRVQDTGVGVDLIDADRLFQPFERGRPISRERSALGLGGSGLGLTIVRMIGDEVGVDVRFDAPDADHSTSVRISWKKAT